MRGIAIGPHGNTLKFKYSTHLQDLRGVGKKSKDYNNKSRSGKNQEHLKRIIK